MEQVILEFTAKTEGLKAAAQELLQLGKITEQQFATYNKATSDANKNIAQSLAATDKQVNTLVTSFTGLTKVIGDAAIKEGVQKLNDLSEQLKAARNETTTLAVAFKMFKASSEAVDALNAVLEGSKKSMGALGFETKGLEAALVKAKAAQEVLNGVEEIGTGIKKAATTAVEAFSIAQQTYNLVVGQSTGALKLFRLALAATGIGALIFVVTELVTNWEKWRDVISGTSGQMKELEKALEQYNKILQQGADNAAHEAAQVRLLGDAIQNTALPMKQRLEALRQYNEVAGAGNRITADQINNSTIVQQQLKKETELILARATIKAAEAELEKRVSDALKREIAARQRLQSATATNKRTQGEGFEKDIASNLGGSDGTDDEIFRQRSDASMALGAAEKEFKAAQTARMEAGKDILALINEIKSTYGLGFTDGGKEFKKVVQEVKEVKRTVEDLPEINVDVKTPDLLLIREEVEGELGKPVEMQLKITGPTDEEIQQAQKQYLQFAFDTFGKVTDTMFEIDAQNREARFNADMQAIEEKKNTELSAKNLTELQKSNIEKKYAAEMRKVKIKQFELEQQAALGQAAIKGALALATLISSTPPTIGPIPNPAYFIGLATVVATTAAQIATIASQKPPAFAKGTKRAPAGLKWVGEQGPELINDNGGYAIISHPDSMQLMQKYDLPAIPAFTPPLPNISSDIDSLQQSVTSNTLAIDYNKLGDVIADKLRNNPSTVINMDKSGLQLHLLDKGKRVEVLNNRYRE